AADITPPCLRAEMRKANVAAQDDSCNGRLSAVDIRRPSLASSQQLSHEILRWSVQFWAAGAQRSVRQLDGSRLASSPATRSYRPAAGDGRSAPQPGSEETSAPVDCRGRSLHTRVPRTQLERGTVSRRSRCRRGVV